MEFCKAVYCFSNISVRNIGLLAGFPRLLENPRKSCNFYWKISRTCKVLKNDVCPGKSWNLLGSDVHGSFWFQIDMFMETKIAIIVAIRYVFWAADSLAAVCCYI